MQAENAPTALVMPVDPMMMAMAVALAEVNRKLDAIMDLQRDMFDYMKTRDKAELRGNLEYLLDIADKYRFNWDNPSYKTAHLQKTVDIKQTSLASIIALRAGIEKRLDKTGIIELRSSSKT